MTLVCVGTLQAADWTLVWSDEFSTEGLPDTSKWNYEQGFVRNQEAQYYTFKNEHSGFDAWPFDKPHYLILNLAIGGSWGAQKGIDPSIFPQIFMIDYVRVYQQEER
jgi:hypothetical protein